MSPPDLATTLSEIRQLTDRYKARTEDSFRALRELFSKLLHFTVVRSSEDLHLHHVAGQEVWVLGGRPDADSPLRLNDGRRLRIMMSLYLDPSDQYKMKVRNSQYQYQEDPEGERPIFRYDYLRTPTRHSRGPYPGSHLHIYGDLTEAGCLPWRTPLARIHFPTRRISLEAIIRLLAFDFEIDCNTEDAFWQPVLAESEHLFREIAHEST